MTAFAGKSAIDRLPNPRRSTTHAVTVACRASVFELCVGAIAGLPFLTVLFRRTISLWLIFTLLVSLVAPASSGPSSCGEAARVEERRAKSQSGHGCHGCRQKSERRVSAAHRSVALFGVDLPELGSTRPNTASYCCSDGHVVDNARVAVATKVSRLNVDFEARVAATEHLLVDAVHATRPAPLPSVDGSPPHLAAAGQLKYLQISSFLI